MLAACTPQTRKDVTPYADFPQTIELQAETVPIDTALFRYAYRIRTQGDTVVVFDLHGSDHFFHAFLGESLEYLSSFGKRGEAPAEIISAENIRLYSDGWWTLDSGKGRLLRFHTEGDLSHPAHEITLDEKEILRPLDFVKYEDGEFIVPDYSGEARFQVSQGYGIPTGIMGFGDVQVTDRAVYAVFSGRTFKELMQSAQQGKDLPDGGQYIYVFSLQGKPLLRYALNRHISGFHVDEEKGVIWATDVNNDQPICKFKINEE